MSKRVPQKRKKPKGQVAKNNQSSKAQQHVMSFDPNPSGLIGAIIYKDGTVEYKLDALGMTPVHNFEADGFALKREPKFCAIEMTFARENNRGMPIKSVVVRMDEDVFKDSLKMLKAFYEKAKSSLGSNEAGKIEPYTVEQLDSVNYETGSTKISVSMFTLSYDGNQASINLVKLPTDLSHKLRTNSLRGILIEPPLRIDLPSRVLLSFIEHAQAEFESDSKEVGS